MVVAAVVVVAVVVVVVIVAVAVVVLTRCHRRGGAGIDDGTSTGSRTPEATLWPSATSGIEIELPLLFDDNVASAVGECLFLKRIQRRRRGNISAARRRRCVYTVHSHTYADTYIYTYTCARRLCRVARLRHRIALDTYSRRPRKVKAGCRACADRFVSCLPSLPPSRLPVSLLSPSSLFLYLAREGKARVRDKKRTIYSVAARASVGNLDGDQLRPATGACVLRACTRDSGAWCVLRRRSTTTTTTSTGVRDADSGSRSRPSCGLFVPERCPSTINGSEDLTPHPPPGHRMRRGEENRRNEDAL